MVVTLLATRLAEARRAGAAWVEAEALASRAEALARRPSAAADALSLHARRVARGALGRFSDAVRSCEVAGLDGAASDGLMNEYQARVGRDDTLGVDQAPGFSFPTTGEGGSPWP